MTVFLIIGGIGLALLVVSLLLGEVFDGIFDGVGGDMFSGAALAAFVGSFGFAGALALSIVDNVAIAIVAGLIVGVLVGAGAGLLTLKLKEGGDEANVNTATLVGYHGTAITAIPADGYGEVSVVASGHITKLNARASEPVRAGTAIEVTAILSATSVMVTPLV